MIFFFCRRFGYYRLSFFLLVCLRILYTFVLRYTTRKVFIFFFYLILRRLGGLGAQGLRGCRCSVMRSVMCSAMRSVLRSVSRNTLILGNLIISINIFVILGTTNRTIVLKFHLVLSNFTSIKWI